jgi:hypothetical protein
MSSRVPTPSKIILSAAASGDVVAALAGKRIRVYAAMIVAAGAVTAQFRTGAAGTVLTGAMSAITGTPIEFSYNEKGWFETDVAGQSLQIVLGGAVQVSGVVSYEYVS